MGNALRCLAVTVAGLALVPAAAQAARVDRDPVTGVITIVDDVGGRRDDIHRRARAGEIDSISRVGGGLTNGTAMACEPDGGGRSGACVGTSFAVDLGGRQRPLQGAVGGRPDQRRGRAGQRRPLHGRRRRTCSRAAPDNDTLDGQRRRRRLLRRDRRRHDRGARRATPSGSPAAPARTRRTTTSSTSSPSASAGSTATATASARRSTATTAAANIFPGAAEVFDNGVDENCDGRDNPNLDRDRDGFPQPLRLRRRQRRDPARRARDPRQQGRRELRPARRPVRRARRRVANQWVFGRQFARLLSSSSTTHRRARGSR